MGEPARRKPKPVTREQRLARHPCPVCYDIWRVVTRKGKRIIGMKCMVQGHAVTGRYRLLANGQKELGNG